MASTENDTEPDRRPVCQVTTLEDLVRLQNGQEASVTCNPSVDYTEVVEQETLHVPQLSGYSCHISDVTVTKGVEFSSTYNEVPIVCEKTISI